MSVLVFFFVLAVLILAHEAGHFLAARRVGIRVEEFGFGFPPRLLRFRRGETLYSLNLIPFGGFVRMEGEDEVGGPASPRSFAGKSARARAFVLASGVLANLLLAWAIISLNLTLGMPASTPFVPEIYRRDAVASIVVIGVSSGSPAEKAGLEAGDRLRGFKTIKEVQDYVRVHRGEDVVLFYERGGKSLSTAVHARRDPPEGEGALGVSMDEAVLLNLPWYRAIPAGGYMTLSFAVLTAEAIGRFALSTVSGGASLADVIGPVGIVGATSAAAKLGLVYLFSFMALLSINLAVLNILPFPALDGGRLLFVLIEKVRRRPVAARTASFAHTVGFALLIALMLAVTYKDVTKLF